MNQETVKVNFGNKIISLKFNGFDGDEIDIDDLLKIDYSNIIGELLTFSVAFNKVALLRAEAQNLVSECKLQVDIKEASLKERYRKKMTRSEDKEVAGGISTKLKGPTQDQVEVAVMTDEVFINIKKKHIRLQKEYDYIDALYWGCQSKDQKLKNIQNITPEDFSSKIIEGSINGVLIKAHKSLIQQK